VARAAQVAAALEMPEDVKKIAWWIELEEKFETGKPHMS
jgi:hypothetical protein